MKGVKISPIYEKLASTGGTLDPKRKEDFTPIEVLIEQTIYADNAFLYNNSLNPVKEQFWRMYVMMCIFSLEIHELFSNHSGLLLEVVSEGAQVGIELKLHPSPAQRSPTTQTLPPTEQEGRGTTSMEGPDVPKPQ